MMKARATKGAATPLQTLSEITVALGLGARSISLSNRSQSSSRNPLIFVRPERSASANTWK